MSNVTFAPTLEVPLVYFDEGFNSIDTSEPSTSNANLHASCEPVEAETSTPLGMANVGSAYIVHIFFRSLTTILHPFFWKNSSGKTVDFLSCLCL